MNIQFENITTTQEELFPKEYNLSTSDKRLRKAVFEVFGGKCARTGKVLSEDNFHIDHVLPKSKGGADNIFNYVLSYPDENLTKGNNSERVATTMALAHVRQVYAPRVIKNIEEQKRQEAKKKEPIKKQREETVRTVESQLFIAQVEERIHNIGKSLLDILKSDKVLLLATKSGRELRVSFDVDFIKDLDPRTFFQSLNGGEYGVYANEYFGEKGKFSNFGITEIIREENNFSLRITIPSNEDMKHIPLIWKEIIELVDAVANAEVEGQEILDFLNQNEENISYLEIVDKGDGDEYQVVFEDEGVEVTEELLRKLVASGKIFFNNLSLDSSIKYRGMIGGEGRSKGQTRRLKKIRFSILPIKGVPCLPKSWAGVEIFLRGQLSLDDLEKASSF